MRPRIKPWPAAAIRGSGLLGGPSRPSPTEATGFAARPARSPTRADPKWPGAAAGPEPRHRGGVRAPVVYTRLAMLLILPGACFFINPDQLEARLAEVPAQGDSAQGSETAATDPDEDSGQPDSGDTGSEGARRLYYADIDGDGSGDAASAFEGTAPPPGFVSNAWDCLDNDATEPVWVALDGSATGTGSIERPYSSASDGILAAQACVRIRGGEYAENIDLGGRNLDIEGIDGAAATTIRAAVQGPVIAVNGGENVRLRGLTLTGGTGSIEGQAAYGGGLIVINPATLAMFDVVLTGNSATNGGGIYSTSPNLELTDVTITGNAAYTGAGLLQEGGSTSGTHVLISGNTGGYGVAIFVASGAVSLANSILNGNLGTEPGDGVYAVGASITLQNCAVVDHDVQVLLDGASAQKSSFHSRNTILAGGQYGVLLYGTNDIDVDYTWVHDHATADWYPADASPLSASQNAQEDPAFVEFTADGVATNDDLHLAAGSPAINAGDPALLDTDGTPSDVGAYGGLGGNW